MRKVLWSVLLLVLVGAVAFGGWLLTLPGEQPAGAPSTISPEEHAATIAALRPPKRQRPVVAVIGINDGTETTDYLMPTGILRRADVAEVWLVATGSGPVTLYPALTVDPDLTLTEFDQRFPDGADYVIVPAMKRDDDARVLNWLRKQSEGGAIIVGVCVGATVVANAGLLDGRRGTTHWYYVEDMLERHPRIEFARDRRYVVDRGVATSTGISASLPLSLALVEAIAGHDKAMEVAIDLGVSRWDARHRSDAFRFTREFAWTALRNQSTFWKHEDMNLELLPGMDEVTLALLADAWSRTFRSRAVTWADNGEPVVTRNGVRVHPEKTLAGELPPPWLRVLNEDTPALALRETLDDIRNRYGDRTETLVARQLEYLAAL